MSIRSSLFALATCTGLAFGICASAAPIAVWTFETSIPTTAGPLTPEVGAGSALSLHAGGATAYTNPAGNGSAESWSANTWAAGDYYQFQVNTTGQSGVYFGFDQTGSATGPRDFKVQYSTDGTTFTDLGSTYTVLVNGAPNTAWNSATASSVYTYGPLVGPSGIFDNQAALYLRVTDASTTSINGGTVAAGGTNRVDNVTVGLLADVPEPATAGVLSAAGLMVLRRRRNG